MGTFPTDYRGRWTLLQRSAHYYPARGGAATETTRPGNLDAQLAGDPQISSANRRGRGKKRRDVR